MPDGAAALRPISIDTPIRFRDPLPDAVDTVVIGAGVIGIFTALYLARLGQRVLVCEKGRVAGEQSSRNWGWIRQQGRDEAELPIMVQARGLWHDADAETGGRCGVTARGATYLARTAEEMRAYDDWITIASRHGVGSRILSADEVRGLFGGESDFPWIGGLHTANDCRGEPWAAVPAVADLARMSGAVIRENCAVRALTTVKNEVRGIVTEDGPVACDQVVLAAGAWSSLFARRHGIDLPQLAVKATVAQTMPMPEFFAGNAADDGLALRRRADGGYSLARTEKHGFFLGPDAVRHAKRYGDVVRHGWREIDLRLAAPRGYPDAWGTPRRWGDGDVTPFETLRVLDPVPNAGYVRTMTRRFAERFPRLGRPSIRHSWAGMIDAMPDVVPVVDRIASVDGLIVATGMSGHGFGIGPGFGRIIARMVMNQSAEHDLARFRYSRFTDGSPLVMGPAL